MSLNLDYWVGEAHRPHQVMGLIRKALRGHINFQKKYNPNFDPSKDPYVQQQSERYALFALCWGLGFEKKDNDTNG